MNGRAFLPGEFTQENGVGSRACPASVNHVLQERQRSNEEGNYALDGRHSGAPPQWAMRSSGVSCCVKLATAAARVSRALELHPHI